MRLGRLHDAFEDQATANYLATYSPNPFNSFGPMIPNSMQPINQQPTGFLAALQAMSTGKKVALAGGLLGFGLILMMSAPSK